MPKSRHSAQTEYRRIVMVVEDDESAAELLLHFLRREGFETWHAADGFAAQTLVRENSPPALVLMDIMLPYVDGISILEQIRKTSGWSEVPIIMLTAKSDEDNIVDALEAGATDYVTKPFQPKALMARIRRLIDDNA